MQLTIDIGYEQLFELVRQLPPREKERFVRDMVKPEQKKCSREKWHQILSTVPTLDSEEVQNLEESMDNFRKEFNSAFERRCLGLVGTD